MRYPSFIEKGNTVGFVAPSFGCAGEPYYSAFQNSLKKWNALGFKTELGFNCYASDGVGISSSPKKCAAEFMEYYKKETNQALISCGGGELMCEILEYIDFGQLKRLPPKWFMGYSDNTNLIFLLATLTDTAAIYGPNAGAFGMEPWHASIQDAYELLQGKKFEMQNYPMWEKESLKDEEHPLLPYNVTEKTEIKTFYGNASEDGSEAVIEGRLLGGCMDCLVNLTGTKYDKVKEFCSKYKNDGIVWFLESCDLNVAAIRRAIWQMSNAGWFDTARGFIIGRPLVFGQEMFGLNQYNAVTDLLKKYNVPIIMDADIGHLAPMMPLICGSKAKVTKKGETLSVEMKLV